MRSCLLGMKCHDTNYKHNKSLLSNKLKKIKKLRQKHATNKSERDRERGGREEGVGEGKGVEEGTCCSGYVDCGRSCSAPLSITSLLDPKDSFLDNTSSSSSPLSKSGSTPLANITSK